jgi:hypothetical protein
MYKELIVPAVGTSVLGVTLTRGGELAHTGYSPWMLALWAVVLIIAGLTSVLFARGLARQACARGKFGC